MTIVFLNCRYLALRRAGGAVKAHKSAFSLICKAKSLLDNRMAGDPFDEISFFFESPRGKFTAILREEEKEGGCWAQCVELLGTISQGETREYALPNIREAIQGFLEAFPEEADRL